MTSASFSIKAFGIYLVITGAAMVIAPNVVLGFSGFPPTNEPWVQVLGALATVLGYYYWACGVAGATAFFRATVFGRIGGFLILGLLVLTGSPSSLLSFGIVDLLGALWTQTALRKSLQSQ